MSYFSFEAFFGRRENIAVEHMRNDKNSKDDRLILTGVNRKDEKVWKKIYERYYASLCAYTAKLVGTPEAVEDLVQEVFIAVWEGERLFATVRELTNYFYRACYNNPLLHIRKNQIHDSILDALSVEEGFDEDELYALTVKEETIRQLYSYIDELPLEQRRIILLRIEGYSWNEVAELLGVSLNTVKTQKSRSYKFLRQKLDGSTYSLLSLFIL